MFLVELAVILLAAKLAGDLASRLGQPPVLGQLVAGLGLGLILFAIGPVPALREAQPELASAANLGVLMLMFLAGLETDWEQMRSSGKAAFVSATLGVLFPLVFGWLVARAFGMGSTEALFVGVILTATSVSITAQTLMELGSLRTVEGATVLGAAVIDDVMGLVVFSLAVAATGSGQTNLLLLALLVTVFFVVTFFAGDRVIPWAVAQAERLHGSEAPLAVALAIGLIVAYLAQAVGIAAITGAYLAGLLINRRGAFDSLTEKVKVVAYGFFVPVFLVKTGMDAQVQDIGTILAFVLAMSSVAIVTKIVGAGLGARLCGLSFRQSLVVGTGMVSRGEVALIVASLGLAERVIPQNVFSSTILVVLVTTLATPPLLRLALRGVPRPTALRATPDDMRMAKATAEHV